MKYVLLLFVLVFSVESSAERWTDKQKWECMSAGGKWRNDSCIRQESSSNSGYEDSGSTDYAAECRELYERSGDYCHGACYQVGKGKSCSATRR